MKIFIKSDDKLDISKLPKILAANRRTDSHDRPLAYAEFYVLKKKTDPYFFGGGSFHSPDLVEDFPDAAQFNGEKLNFANWDWTKDWVAIPVQTPSDEIVFGLKKKTAQTEEAHKELVVNPVTPTINPLDGKTNEQARRIARNVVSKHSLGLFSDEYWLGPKRVFDAMNEAQLDWHLTDTQYGVSKNLQEMWPGEKWRIPNDYKVWKFEINFTNNKGRPTILYGTLTAHGAGSTSDPLSKYDMSVIIG